MMADAILLGHNGEPSLTDRVSALVVHRAEQLVAEWQCRWADKGGDTGAGTLDGPLLRHVALMIDAVGRHVQSPSRDAPTGISRHAAAYASAVTGLHASGPADSLDDLSALIMQRIAEEVRCSGVEYSTRSVLTVFERLAEGLRAMTSITRACYQEREEDGHRRQLRRLSDSGLLLGHELRSCLNSILLSAEILARPELCDDLELQGKQLDGIRSAVVHAEELLRGADECLVAPAAPPKSRMVPLQHVFEAVRKELEGRARASNVILMFQKSMPPWSVDAAVAGLALSNLLVNAIKYADAAKPARWVNVLVEPAEGDDPAALVMKVADNGLGIPVELQRRVLLRSFRAHPQVAEGTGLGLALTRERLADQGGSIDLVSEEGVGTTVRVTLRAQIDGNHGDLCFASVSSSRSA